MTDARFTPRRGAPYGTVDEVVKEMKKLPFFMTELDEEAEVDNEHIDALKALVYEGEPDEIALNFKNQGKDCYKAKKFHDAIAFYTKALEVKSGVDDIEVACYVNRAACNLELKNYRKCINDCRLALARSPRNIKAVYRSARAYLAVDRIDEAIDIANYGLSIEPENLSIKNVVDQATKRKNALVEFQKKREAIERLKEQKKNNLEKAIQSRNLTVINTDQTSEEMLRGLKIQLEDDMDPSSGLKLPVLFLYPLELETDLIEAAQETATILDYLEQVFESPPPWFEKSSDHVKDYDLKNLQVYVQTKTGGLARLGKNSTILKILSLKAPVVPIIDNVVRFYIVPQNRAQEWIKSWNKDHALRQMGIY